MADDDLNTAPPDDDLNLTITQAKKCLDIMKDAIELLQFARPTLSLDQILTVLHEQYIHSAAGDTAMEELGPFADLIVGATPGPDA